MEPDERARRSDAYADAARKRYEAMGPEERAAFHRKMTAGQARSTTRVPNMARARYRKAGLPEHEIDYLMTLAPMERKMARIRERDFGIKPMEYRDLVARQGGLCALCETPVSGKNCHLDHDHISGHVRGILCAGCNLALGHVESRGMAWVGRAFAYISAIAGPEVGSGWEAPILAGDRPD